MALDYKFHQEKDPSAADIISEVNTKLFGKCSYCGNIIDDDHIEKYHPEIVDEVFSSFRYHGRRPKEE